MKKWEEGVKAIDKAREHFCPLLTTAYFGKETFVLVKDDTTIVAGALATALLFLDRFVKMFGDLIVSDDYSIVAFKKRNRDKNFMIYDR